MDLNCDLAVIKKSFDWLDQDGDNKISIEDLEKSFEIPYSEASKLLASLSQSKSSFISFEEFSEEFPKFPSVIEKFKNNLASHSSFILNLDLNSADEVLDHLTIKDLFKYKKQEIVLFTDKLLSHSIRLKQELHKKISLIQSQLLETQAKNRDLRNEKKRIESHYEDLLQEHQKLQSNFNGLEKKIAVQVREIKDRDKQTRDLEKENDELLKSLSGLKTNLEQKQDIINSLNLKVKEHVLSKDQFSPSNKSKLLKSVPYLTPQGLKNLSLNFSFTEAVKGLNPKDQIIKNLKRKIKQFTSHCEKLEKKTSDLLTEKTQLLEKVKLLSSSRTLTEDDDSTNNDLHASLQDELLMVDSNIMFKSRQSVFLRKGFKDESTQVFSKDLKKKKKRFACLSFF